MRQRKRKVTEAGGSGGLDVAPAVSKWLAACFPHDSPSSEHDLRELIGEAADAARNDLNEQSVVELAEGYEVPSTFVESDTALLRASALDFERMVECRLKILLPDRLSADRVNGLRADNLERGLMLDLAAGMRAFLPEGFTPSGSEERSKLRKSYVSVAPAVNKMLGELVKQRLAFTLPLDMALQHIKNLHLNKAHWCIKKKKPSGRPLGDLSNVDGTPLNTPGSSEEATASYGQIVL
jgi:hypothetical protein